MSFSKCLYDLDEIVKSSQSRSTNRAAWIPLLAKITQSKSQIKHHSRYTPAQLQSLKNLMAEALILCEDVVSQTCLTLLKTQINKIVPQKKVKQAQIEAPGSFEVQEQTNASWTALRRKHAALASQYRLPKELLQRKNRHLTQDHDEYYQLLAEQHVNLQIKMRDAIFSTAIADEAVPAATHALELLFKAAEINVFRLKTYLSSGVPKAGSLYHDEFPKISAVQNNISFQICEFQRNFEHELDIVLNNEQATLDNNFLKFLEAIETDCLNGVYVNYDERFLSLFVNQIQLKKAAVAKSEGNVIQIVKEQVTTALEQLPSTLVDAFSTFVATSSVNPEKPFQFKHFFKIKHSPVDDFPFYQEQLYFFQKLTCITKDMHLYHLRAAYQKDIHDKLNILRNTLNLISDIYQQEPFYQAQNKTIFALEQLALEIETDYDHYKAQWDFFYGEFYPKQIQFMAGYQEKHQIFCQAYEATLPKIEQFYTQRCEKLLMPLRPLLALAKQVKDCKLSDDDNLIYRADEFLQLTTFNNISLYKVNEQVDFFTTALKNYINNFKDTIHQKLLELFLQNHQVNLYGEQNPINSTSVCYQKIHSILQARVYHFAELIHSLMNLDVADQVKHYPQIQVFLAKYGQIQSALMLILKKITLLNKEEAGVSIPSAYAAALEDKLNLVYMNVNQFDVSFNQLKTTDQLDQWSKTLTQQIERAATFFAQYQSVKSESLVKVQLPLFQTTEQVLESISKEFNRIYQKYITDDQAAILQDLIQRQQPKTAVLAQLGLIEPRLQQLSVFHDKLSTLSHDFMNVNRSMDVQTYKTQIHCIIQTEILKLSDYSNTVYPTWYQFMRLNILKPLEDILINSGLKMPNFFKIPQPSMTEEVIGQSLGKLNAACA